MDCPIHLGVIPLNTDAAAALPCGHVFCMTCIMQWFDSKPIAGCPVCKKTARAKQVLRLYTQPRSPSSSPTKNLGPSQLSGAAKRSGQCLRQDLQDLGTEPNAEDVRKTCTNMERFADNIAGTSEDIEAKCLAEEIKAAAARFQSLILPELKELESLRTQLEALKSDKTSLSIDLRQKSQQIDQVHHDNNTLKQKCLNLQMSKNVADDACSNFRRSLEITQEKLVDADNTIRAKDEKIKEIDAQVCQYRAWLTQNKAKVETLKTKIKKLESALEEQASRSESATPCEPPTEDIFDNVGPGLDGEPDLEPVTKKRRLEQEESLRDIKLERGCFLGKPKSSFQIPKKDSERRKAGQEIPGLTMSNGRLKSTVLLGSRVRMGKKG